MLGRWIGLSLVVFAACSAVPPAELARRSPDPHAREGRFVVVAGHRLFAITKGEGRDLVLVHGNPASTYSWRKVIDPLAEHYRVHAIDLPGFGFSDKPDDAPYTTDWLASFVVGYLDEEKIRRAVLVGNSMGGHVVTETAILHPDRVSALVLIDAAGLPLAEPRKPPLLIRMVSWPVVGPVLRALPSRRVTRSRLRDAVYDPDDITDADVDAYYAPLRSDGGLNAFLARMDQKIPKDRPDKVKEIRAPTLILVGDSDRLVPRQVSERYHELIAGSELEVFEKTGHLPQEEDPARTVAEIRLFLDAHP